MCPISFPPMHKHIGSHRCWIIDMPYKWHWQNSLSGKGVGRGSYLNCSWKLHHNMVESCKKIKSRTSNSKEQHCPSVKYKKTVVGAFVLRINDEASLCVCSERRSKCFWVRSYKSCDRTTYVHRTCPFVGWHLSVSDWLESDYNRLNLFKRTDTHPHPHTHATIKLNERTCETID